MPVSSAQRLVITYAFVPFVDTSGTVAAKRICLRGEPVDVIQNDLGSLRAVDPDLDLVADGLVRRRAVLGTPVYFSDWGSIEAFSLSGLEQVDRWVAESREAGDLLEHGLPWTSLYSRAHFVASHFLAALLKAEHPDLIWEAEFSDPCSVDATGKPRPAAMRDTALVERLRSVLAGTGYAPPPEDDVMQWAETLAYALADEIHFTNAQQAEFMISRCHDEKLAQRVRERTVVAHHPMLPARFYELDQADLELEPDRIHIAYFGNFYGKQSPVDAINGMALLPAELRSKLRLHIFTQPVDRLRRTIATQGLDDCVTIEEFLPFLQFLDAARRMDLLLVVDYPLPAGAARNPFLLSKWGDYRGSGTPVWGILEESSVLSATTDPALQLRSPVGHATAAAQILAQLARGALVPDRVLASPDLIA